MKKASFNTNLSGCLIILLVWFSLTCIICLSYQSCVHRMNTPNIDTLTVGNHTFIRINEGVTHNPDCGCVWEKIDNIVHNYQNAE